MYPHEHLGIGIILSILMYPYLELWQAAVFLLATVLIDFDHFALHVVMHNNMSLKKAYRYFKTVGKKYKDPGYKGTRKYHLLVFHSFEYLFVMAALSYVHPFFFYVFLGSFLHLSLDIINNPNGMRNRLNTLKSWVLTYRILSQKGIKVKMQIQ